MYHVPWRRPQYRAEADPAKPILGSRSALDLLHERLHALPGVASEIVMCPNDQRSEAVTAWATAHGLQCCTYEESEARDKPRYLQQERWALEGDRGHDDLPGSVLARLAEQNKAELILVVPTENLMLDRESVQASLKLQFREGFDFLWSYDRLCGANWMILKSEALIGLQKHHPEMMGVKGGLVWVLQKPLYPFRAGEYHSPRVHPILHADLRCIDGRLPAALGATLGPNATANREFHYADWVGRKDWALAYADVGPQVVRVEPSSRCGAACEACPHRLLQRSQVDLPLAVWKNLVEGLKNTNCRWEISGIGEPLLHSQIATIVSDIGDRHVKLETSLQVEPPNDFPYQAIDLLSLSVDALEPNRFARLRPGCSWENLQVFLARQAENKAADPERWPEVGVTMTKHQGNADLDLSFLDYWKKVTTPVFRSDFFQWPLEQPAVSAQWYQIRGCSDYLGFQPYAARIRYVPLKRRTCRHALLAMHVLSDGRVTICPFDVEGKWVLGDLHRQTPLEIWRSEQARSFRQQHLEGNWDPVWPCSACQDWYHP